MVKFDPQKSSEKALVDPIGNDREETPSVSGLENNRTSFTVPAVFQRWGEGLRWWAKGAESFSAIKG